MKKHVFGFALFVLIVVAFTFVFAFFRAGAIPEVLAVEDPKSLPVRSIIIDHAAKSIPHEVIGAYFDLDSGKLISKIKVKLDKNGPKELIVRAELTVFQSFRSELCSPARVQSFSSENEAIVVFEENVVNAGQIDRNDNLYVSFSVYDKAFSPDDAEIQGDLATIQQVLFVHGNESILKN